MCFYSTYILFEFIYKWSTVIMITSYDWKNSNMILQLSDVTPE